MLWVSKNGGVNPRYKKKEWFWSIFDSLVFFFFFFFFVFSRFFVHSFSYEVERRLSLIMDGVTKPAR